MKLTSSRENYLETIFLLEDLHGHAHIRDIASELGVKKPSVSEALSRLKEDGLVNYNPYSTVNLTTKGEVLAQQVLKRHRTIFRLLRDVLHVNEATAESDACKIEHVISPETFNKMVKYIGR